MITTTLSFIVHIMGSYRMLRPVVQLVQYVLPYQNMTPKAIAARNINYDSKHLKKGDPLPPWTGKPRLYNMRFCPYAQRAVLALNAKNVDYEIVNVNLIEKPEWLYKKSPLGKVPSLEIKENFCIFESLVLVEYLDEVYPQRPLLPKDPIRKAYDKIIVEVAGAIHTLFVKILKSPKTITKDTVNGYLKALDFIQEQLKSRGTTFLDGDEPGFADYMIWPWFERMVACKAYDTRAAIDPTKYELLTQYINTMMKDPVVTDYFVPDEISLEFIKDYKTGNTNYEILNEK